MANILNLGLSAVATGTVDGITATYSPAITLTDRRIVYLRTLGTNTVTAPTFNPNGLGAQTITKGGGSALAVGDLDGDVILMYDLANTNWELLTPKAVSSSTPTLAQVLGAGQSVNGQSILSANNLNYLQLFDAGVVVGFDDGLGVLGDVSLDATKSQLYFEDPSGSGYVRIIATDNTVYHDLLLKLSAPNVNLPQETASLILSTDASKNIKGLSTTTYPSLTELAYVKGVTSAIQTQLNGKEPLKGSDDNYVTDAQLVVIGNTSGTNSGNETTATLGATINSATSATPNDTDLVPVIESSVVKKNTWTQIKAFLKTYFDTLYASQGFTLQSASTAVNPGALSTHSFADANIGTSTTYNSLVRIYVPKACYLKSVKVFVKVAGTLAVGGQNSTFSLVLNGVTDNDVSTTVKHDSTGTLVSKDNFNVAFANGDWFNFKIVHPTWGTPPTSVSYTVTSYFENL